MAKTERIHKKKKKGGKPLGKKHGAAHRIEAFKEKYPEITTLVHKQDRKPGTPAYWKVDYTRQIFWLALLGITEREMANIIGISIDLFNLWKKSHPDFLAALQKGRTEAPAMAANTLFRRAMGWEHLAVKMFPNRVKEYDPRTGKLVREYTEIIEHEYVQKYPPDVAALKHFLAAKFPEIWGDKSEVKHTGEIEHKYNLKDMSVKKLKKLKKIGKILKEESERQQFSDIN